MVSVLVRRKTLMADVLFVFHRTTFRTNSGLSPGFRLAPLSKKNVGRNDSNGTDDKSVQALAEPCHRRNTTSSQRLPRNRSQQHDIRRQYSYPRMGSTHRRRLRLHHSPLPSHHNDLRTQPTTPSATRNTRPLESVHCGSGGLRHRILPHQQRGHTAHKPDNCPSLRIDSRRGARTGFCHSRDIRGSHETDQVASSILGLGTTGPHPLFPATANARFFMIML